MTDLTALLTRFQEVEQAATPGHISGVPEFDCPACVAAREREALEVAARNALPALIEVALAAEEREAARALVWEASMDDELPQASERFRAAVVRMDAALTALTERLRGTLEGSGE